MHVHINGVNLAYSDQGQGHPLVFVHAFPLNRRMWEPQVQTLSTTFRTITIDLRGHGESDAPMWRYTMEQFADDVIGVLDHLSISQATFVGLSMGGYTLLALYRTYPQRVSGLVLADTRAEADTEDVRTGRMSMAQIAYQKGAETIAKLMLPKLLSSETVTTKPHLVEVVHSLITTTKISEIVGDLIGMADRPAATDLLPTIACPTLVIVGEDDVATPPTDVQLMAERIPQARFEIIPHAGHLSNLEQPEAFNHALNTFLQPLKTH